MITERTKYLFFGWRKGLRLLMALATLVSSAAPALIGVQPVKAGSQFLWWTDTGDTFFTFGANASIVIDTGSLDFTTGCPAPGIDDNLYAAAFVYIMPSGSVTSGTILTDLSTNGRPNTVVASSGGGFVGETIGFTQPSGVIGPGTYAVIYDECQDEIYDPGTDFLLDPAFEVIIPADVPALPSIQAVKDLAVARSDYWSDAKFYLNALFKLADWIDANGEKLGEDPLESIHKPFTAALEVYHDTMEHFFPDPKEIAMTQLANAISHWQGIAADPPDPDFEQLSPLQSHPLIDLHANDELLQSLALVGTEAGEEAALAEALLRSLERYQGADQANDGTWALAHARAVKEYADLLADQFADSGGAAAEAYTAISADTRPLDQAALDFEQFRSRVHTTGWNSDELRYAKNLGISDAQLEDIQSVLAAVEVAGFTKAGLLNVLDGMANNAAANAATLTALSSAMHAVISSLENAPGVSLLAPTADAGGPYNGVEGSPISLNALGSTSPYTNTISAYGWDLDGGGVFTDTSGATPSYTYQQAFAGWLGVKVTNLFGFSDIDYAKVTVASANQPPGIASFLPEDLFPNVIVGAPLNFQATASDPDSDPVSITWLLDGAPAASGGAYTFAPTAAQVGMHVIQAQASDAHPLGGSVLHTWTATVLLPDGDGDLWRANADCNDSDPQINPGQAEVLFNGTDDDCNPITPDNGNAPVALFNPLPQSGPYNAARYEHGASVASTSNMYEVNSYKLLDDDELSYNSLRTYATGGWAKVLLAGGDTYLIDRVKVSGSNNGEAVRHFEIAVSTTTDDDAAFTVVLLGETQPVPGNQEFLLPAPVLAKYVRYRIFDNQQGYSYIRTQRLMVMSGQKSAGNTVTFQDASSDVNNDIVTRLWDFGDGATSTEVNPTHAFPGPGIYTVALTVTDSAGHVAAFSLEQEIFDTSDPDGPALGAPDSRGTDFWITFMRNGSATGTTEGHLHLYISGETATSGKVTVPRLNTTADFQVTPGQITTVALPTYLRAQGEYTRPSGLEDLGIHITAGAEVTVYGMNRASVSTDAFTALPTDALGTNYLAMAYTSGAMAWYGGSSQFAVVAVEENTQITITASTFAYSGPPNPGDTYTLTMQRGEVHQFVADYTWITDGDVTGSWIRSNKPVAVFGGNSCVFIPTHTMYCDHIVEQIPPTSTWGKEFVTVPLASRANGDTFRVLAAEDDTHFQVNDQPAVTLNRGQFSEFILTEASHIVADKPVLLAQYSHSFEFDHSAGADPFMMLVPPYEQFMNDYTVMTPLSGFTWNYINLVAPEMAVGSLTMDGTAIPAESFSPVGSSGFYEAQIAVDPGVHQLSSASPFGVFIYGYQNGPESYGYPGGSALAQVANAASLEVEVDASEQGVGNQVCATARVLDANSQGIPGVRVDFAVSGANNLAGSAFSDANGEALFCYSASTIGEDSLTARMSALQAVAQVMWMARIYMPLIWRS
ncbi:MAG: PKD domain-containing protein [Chloroflexota bacterium]